MNLADYLHQERLTYRDFAERVDRDVSCVWRWAKGKAQPDIDMALRIQKLTNGQVAVADFASEVE